MFYVKLKNPLPGVRSEIFFFYNELEAEEFASCLHAMFDDGRPFGRDASGAPTGHLGCETVQGVAGEATEVFPGWSF